MRDGEAAGQQEAAGKNVMIARAGVAEIPEQQNRSDEVVGRDDRLVSRDERPDRAANASRAKKPQQKR